MENINEENKPKAFWITDNRLIFIAIVLFLMLLVFMTLIYLKGDEISRDPCSICAEQMGEDVVCSLSSGTRLLQRTYHIDSTITGE